MRRDDGQRRVKKSFIFFTKGVDQVIDIRILLGPVRHKFMSSGSQPLGGDASEAIADLLMNASFSLTLN